MHIEIPNNKLKRTIEDDEERKKHFGMEMAKKIKLRMASLVAAESLADFLPPYFGPERCHELKGNLEGTFSIDLKHPYRLLFQPINADTQAKTSSVQEYWQSITSIEITGIKDTHD
jgi:plasmid maintenance system killer protein